MRPQRWMLTIGLLLLVACSQEDSGEQQAPGEAFVPNVDVASARLEPIKESVQVVGSLAAIDRVMVAPEIDGRVVSIEKREGRTVEAEEPLVRLDDDILQLRVEEAQAQLALAKVQLEVQQAAVDRASANASNAEANYQRKKELFDREATTQAVLTEAETAWLAAKAGVAFEKARLRSAQEQISQAQLAERLAEEQLEHTVIRAPFDGMLGQRRISLGDYVRKGDRLFEIIKLQPLEVVFQVPERFQSRLREDLQAEITLEAYPDRVFSGPVTYRAPAVAAETRTVLLKAELNNDEGLLSPGSFCRVRLVFSTRENPVVPEGAVVPRGDSFFVYVVIGSGEDRKVEKRQVELGERLPGRVEIRSGVEPEELVVAAGLQRINDGAPVRVRQEIEAPPVEDSSPKRQPEDEG